MSVTSWQGEFWPFSYSDRPIDDPASDLLKWKGLRRENLIRHNVKLDMDYKCLVSAECGGGGDFSLSISDMSCSLCAKYYTDENMEENGEYCKGCPLAKEDGLGNIFSCFDFESYMFSGDRRKGPYLEWTTTGNLEPMIEALQKAVDERKKKNG